MHLDPHRLQFRALRELLVPLELPVLQRSQRQHLAPWLFLVHLDPQPALEAVEELPRVQVHLDLLQPLFLLLLRRVQRARRQPPRHLAPHQVVLELVQAGQQRQSPHLQMPPRPLAQRPAHPVPLVEQIQPRRRLLLEHLELKQLLLRGHLEPKQRPLAPQRARLLQPLGLLVPLGLRKLGLKSLALRVPLQLPSQDHLEQPVLVLLMPVQLPARTPLVPLALPRRVLLAVLLRPQAPVHLDLPVVPRTKLHRRVAPPKPTLRSRLPLMQAAQAQLRAATRPHRALQQHPVLQMKLLMLVMQLTRQRVLSTKIRSLKWRSLSVTRTAKLLA